MTKTIIDFRIFQILYLSNFLFFPKFLKKQKKSFKSNNRAKYYFFTQGIKEPVNIGKTTIIVNKEK